MPYIAYAHGIESGLLRDIFTESKMKAFFLLAVLFVMPAFAKAQEAAEAEKARPELIHEAYCNTEQVLFKGIADGKKLSPEQMNSLKEEAKSIQEILVNPKKLQSVIGDPNVNIGAAIGVAFACDLVLQMSDLVAQKGCKDMNGAPLNADEGIQYCRALFQSVSKDK
jgi:hypothetical protein